MKIDYKMQGYLYIKKDHIGTVDFQVIDETMGVIGGTLHPSELYQVYREIIQSLCDKNGIANIHDLHFSIILEDNTQLDPEGGIGITDISGIDEIYVESAGHDDEVIEKINNQH